MITRPGGGRPVPLAPVAVILAAAVAVAVMVLAIRPSRGGAGQKDRTEKDNIPKGKD